MSRSECIKQILFYNKITTCLEYRRGSTSTSKRENVRVWERRWAISVFIFLGHWKLAICDVFINHLNNCPVIWYCKVALHYSLIFPGSAFVIDEFLHDESIFYDGHTKALREKESFTWWVGCRCPEAQHAQHKCIDILRYDDCQWGFYERCPHLNAHLSRLSQKSETGSGGWAGKSQATAKWRNQMCFWRNFNRLSYSLCPPKEVVLLTAAHR